MAWHGASRRHFLETAAAVGVAAWVGAPSASAAGKPQLKKAVKFGMIRSGNSIQEKFELIKSLGFHGVEMDSPSNIDVAEAVAARDATGIVIHGVVDSVHWKDTLSAPDEAVRARGLAGLLTALRDCKAYGGSTALLVPGVVKDGVSFQECWSRSAAEVRKAIPLADQLGVKIAIEVVWNNFITNSKQFVEYIDQFQSPTVGGYFDCSNMLKYGEKSADWIRRLGKRMLKFDFKGYSLSKAKATGSDWKGFDVGIGEGDEEWPEVLKALAEVGYSGWATAEVAGGGPKELGDISKRMDRIFQLD